jgi:exo-1,4-beta-D-glucosaminidase
VPATTKPPTPAQTYFIELLLVQHGQVVDRNVYWLSTQKDLVNWAKTIGNPQATMTRYANLTALETLPAAAVNVTAHTHVQPGADGDDTVTDVTITNTSTTKTVAFFIRADIRRGSASGVPDPGDNEVLPTLWSDNDITLWPGESETLEAAYRTADLRGRAPVVSVFGWNVPGIAVSAS